VLEDTLNSSVGTNRYTKRRDLKQYHAVGSRYAVSVALRLRQQWPHTSQLVADSLEFLCVDIVANSNLVKFVILAWIHHLAYLAVVGDIAKTSR